VVKVAQKVFSGNNLLEAFSGRQAAAFPRNCPEEQMAGAENVPGAYGFKLDPKSFAVVSGRKGWRPRKSQKPRITRRSAVAVSPAGPVSKLLD